MARTDCLVVVYSLFCNWTISVSLVQSNVEAVFEYSEQKPTFENRAYIYAVAVRWHWQYYTVYYAYVIRIGLRELQPALCLRVAVVVASGLWSGRCVIQNVGQRLDVRLTCFPAALDVYATVRRFLDVVQTYVSRSLSLLAPWRIQRGDQRATGTYGFAKPERRILKLKFHRSVC